MNLVFETGRWVDYLFKANDVYSDIDLLRSVEKVDDGYAVRSLDKPLVKYDFNNYNKNIKLALFYLNHFTAELKSIIQKNAFISDDPKQELIVEYLSFIENLVNSNIKNCFFRETPRIPTNKIKEHSILQLLEIAKEIDENFMNVAELFNYIIIYFNIVVLQFSFLFSHSAKIDIASKFSSYLGVFNHFKRDLIRFNEYYELFIEIDSRFPHFLNPVFDKNPAILFFERKFRILKNLCFVKELDPNLKEKIYETLSAKGERNRVFSLCGDYASKEIAARVEKKSDLIDSFTFFIEPFCYLFFSKLLYTLDRLHLDNSINSLDKLYGIYFELDTLARNFLFQTKSRYDSFSLKDFIVYDEEFMKLIRFAQ